MFSLPNGKITLNQILLPVSLVAFVVFIMVAFQFTQILQDRGTMQQAKTQQQKPLEDAQRVDAQLNALAVGTLKLSEKGDKDAKAIIDRMKKLGITVNDKLPAAAAVPPGAPMAMPGRNAPMPPRAMRPPTPLNEPAPPPDR
jgi:hypothetical protein